MAHYSESNQSIGGSLKEKSGTSPCGNLIFPLGTLTKRHKAKKEAVREKEMVQKVVSSSPLAAPKKSNKNGIS